MHLIQMQDAKVGEWVYRCDNRCGSTFCTFYGVIWLSQNMITQACPQRCGERLPGRFCGPGLPWWNTKLRSSQAAKEFSWYSRHSCY